MLNRSRRRFTGGLVTALALVGLATPAARAAVDLGDLFVTPATGTVADNVYLNFDTHAPCPEGTANVKVSINGPGITDTSSNNLNGVTSLAATVPNDQGGFGMTAAITLKEIFQAYGVVSPAGQYTINLRCQNSTGGTVYGDFLAVLNVTASGTAFEGSYALVPPTPNGQPTTTTLAAAPVSPVTAGTATTLTATVTPAAAGTVQFKDGATNLGAPVPVNGGVATSSPVTLAAGGHSLSAVFSSSDQNAYLDSASAAAAFVVAGVPVVAGVAQVGRTLTCATSAGGTQAYRWLVNGAATASTAKSVVAPGTWYNKAVACRATFTHNGTSVVQTSAARKLALGVRLAYRVRPKVLGITRVGRLLTCSPGSWSPAASAYRYQWFRGTRPIYRAVGLRYRTVRVDKGKLITCRVTALKTGYASGVAKAPARRIS